MLKNKDEVQTVSDVINKNTKVLNETVINRQKIDFQSDVDVYEEFCKENIDRDFSKFTIEELEEIYNDGNMLLDLFFVSSDNGENLKIDTISKLQYVMSNIMYSMSNKKYESNTINSKDLQNRINQSIVSNETLRKELRNTKKEIAKINNDVNSIITTIISIVLTVSVISSAVVGIENINPNYIIPFVSSIMFFGMFMIVFVYSIYKNEIKIRTWIIVIVTFIICIFLWIGSICGWINMEKSNIDDKGQGKEEISIDA